MLEGAGGPVALQTSSDWRRQYRGGKFRLLWCAVGSGGDMQAAARECWSWELEGRSPSRPLRIGEDGTGEGEPRFCGAQSGRRRYAELLRGFDARGSWRAGRPPDLPAREKAEAGCQLLRMRPSGPYIAGLRPATPQSPERLRSTPFDCVAIAPCCFAFRKAVLSHALAALTALNGVRAKPCRHALRR